MSASRKLSFAAGLISKEFYGRVDQVRNQTGLAILKNFHTIKSGALQNRTGTKYKATVLVPTATVRTRQWIFNVDQTYQLEFSNLKLAFWEDGVPIIEATKTITAATKANPGVLTSAAHGFSVNDKVYIASVAGMTQLNSRYWIVGTVPTGDTFTLQYSGDGTAYGTTVNTTNFTTYTSGGTAARVYTIATPYVTADLPDLKFAQSADTMIITHGGYEPRSLTRASDTSWTLAVLGNGPSTAFPTSGSASGTGSATTVRYMVCAFDESTGIGSLSGSAHTKTVTAITKANPAAVTCSATHGYATGDEVIFTTVSGMSELSNRRFRILLGDSGGANTTTIFRLVGENSTSYTTFTSGSVYLSHINVTADTPTAAAPITVVTNATAGADLRYDVYKEYGGIYGFIGSTYALTFSDTGITPDTLDSVPIYREPFYGSGNWPSSVAFYQQRLILGGTDNNPNGVETSFIGDYANFSIHSPHKDADAVSFTTAGYVDSIFDMVPLDKLVALTGGAEFVVAGGGEGNSLTPTETNVRPRTFNGSSGLFPLLIDSNILYQDRGQQVRDFHYSITADNYVGVNRSLFVPDLFKGKTIVDWAYQRTPNSIVWAVLNDGSVISMTYQPDQEMFGWAEHPFYGATVENVCVIPEGSGATSEDAVYFVVARTLSDLSTTRYVERLTARTFTDIKDAIFVDSCLSFDGTGTGSVTLSGSGWTNATSLTATFGSVQTWSASTVGDDIQVNGLDADGEATQIRCRVTGYTSTTILTVIPHATVPVPMRTVAITDWCYAPDSFSGLDHLEGKLISILGDGYVVASALNARYETTYTVASGAITLTGEQRFGKVHMGIPITADAQTLPINPPEDGRFMHRTKLVNMVAMNLSDSRGLWSGALAPLDDDADPIQYLYEAKVRNAETYGEPVDLFTGTLKVRTKARWDTNGQVFCRQLEPLPVTILSLSASGDLY